jgi:hypothetical protein
MPRVVALTLLTFAIAVSGHAQGAATPAPDPLDYIKQPVKTGLTMTGQQAQVREQFYRDHFKDESNENTLRFAQYNVENSLWQYAQLIIKNCKISAKDASHPLDLSDPANVALLSYYAWNDGMHGIVMGFGQQMQADMPMSNAGSPFPVGHKEGNAFSIAWVPSKPGVCLYNCIDTTTYGQSSNPISSMFKKVKDAAPSIHLNLSTADVMSIVSAAGELAAAASGTYPLGVSPFGGAAPRH